MKTALYQTWTVTIAYEWQKEFGTQEEGGKYHFGSLLGCREWITNQIARGYDSDENKVLWYSIEGINHYPCDDNNPDGQLYGGMIYIDFQEVQY